MKPLVLSTLFAAAIAVLSMDRSAEAGRRGQAALAPAASWHGEYYEGEWGMPVAVVVPPTAENQVHYGWGVGATRVTPISHQFQPVPLWPTDTDQLGKYYIRGPW